MDFVDESTIERYIRYPETLASQKRAEVESQLKSDIEARAVAEFYQTYYEELDGLTQYVLPELESFIDTLFVPSTVVPLFLYDPQSSDTVSIASSDQAFSFNPITVLAAHSPQALVCILRSNARPAFYRLYVLTGELRDRAHTLVSFPELALDVVTNATGTANFRLSDQSSQTAPFETALLRFPIAQLQLSTDQLIQATSMPSAIPENDSFQLSLDEDTMVLTIDADDATFPAVITHVACEAKDGTVQLFQMDEVSQTVRLTDIPLDQACRVYLYS